MGYESRLFVGVPSSHADPDGCRWLNMEATLELGKLNWDDAWSDLLDKYPAPKFAEWFVFGSDGDTEIRKDCYGEFIKRLPYDEVVEALKQCDSPRASAAAAFLEEFARTFKYATVLHFGH